MNLKPILRYHAKEGATALAWFYGILLVAGAGAYFLFRYLIARYGGSSAQVTMGGAIGITGFFLFIAGLNSYRTELFLSLQNGISRKTLFVSLLILGAALAAVTGVMDLLIDYAMRTLTRPLGLNILSFEEILVPASPVPLLSRFLAVSFMNGSAFFAGVLITTLFYRLNTPGKVLVPVGAGILLIALSFYDASTGRMTGFAQSVADFSRAGIPQFLLVSAIGAVLLFGFTWLMQRRAQIKTNLS